MTNTWLIRRPVASPVRGATAACISSSVCRLPFISASTWPSRASLTATSAASWLCSVPINDRPAIGRSCAAATGADPVLRANEHRDDQPGLGCLEGAQQAVTVNGVNHRRPDRLERLGPASQLAEQDSAVVQLNLGQHHLRAADLPAGAITVAVPSITTSPRWLTQRQSKEIRWRAGSFAAAVTDTVIVSAIITGR